MLAKLEDEDAYSTKPRALPPQDKFDWSGGQGGAGAYAGNNGTAPATPQRPDQLGPDPEDHAAQRARGAFRAPGTAPAAAAPAPATAPAAPAPAAAPSQTFAQLQTAGMARPAPPAPAMYGPVNSPGSDAIRAQIAAMMANPNSAYGSDQVMSTYQRGSQDIDDDFDGRQARLVEEMAGRGLSDSSIRGGRSADLNVGRRTGKTELMDSLLREQAKTTEESKQRTLAQALTLMGMDSQQALGYAGLNMQANSINQNAYDAAEDRNQRGSQFDRRQTHDEETSKDNVILDFLKTFGFEGFGSADDGFDPNEEY